MNLSDIYQRVFDLADWNPSSSPEAKARVIRFINMSYFQMALDAPYLFFEGMVDMATEPDVDRSNRSDTLSVFTNGSDADPWVLKRNLPTTHHTSPTLWKVDGTWNGRKIQVQDSEGDWHIHTIRDVWTDSTYQYVSLLRPFTDTTQTGSLSPRQRQRNTTYRLILQTQQYLATLLSTSAGRQAVYLRQTGHQLRSNLTLGQGLSRKVRLSTRLPMSGASRT